MTEKPHAGHGDDHGHGHSPWNQHHYDDAQHQFDSGKLGIWLFLAQEVLFFSALFVAYILYRHHHPEIYAYAHKYLDVKFGAINTAVLIFSSLTAAWAVRAAQLRQRRLLIACLAATLVCACAFLAIKYVEYTHKIHEHLLPGKYFDPCISANGSPLLSKNNECPGSKGSVVYNFDKAAPETGCFPIFAVDQKPSVPGIQAECTVTEGEMVKITDDKGEPLVDPDSKMAVFFPPANPKPVAKQCASHAEGEHGGEACWKFSEQPNVCRPGWFYSMRCTAGPGMEQLRLEYEKTLKTFEAMKSSKDAKVIAELKKRMNDIWIGARCDKTEVYSWSPWHADQGACNAAKSKREDQLTKIRNAEGEQKCPKPKPGDDGKVSKEDQAARDACLKENDAGLTRFEVTDCQRADQVGVVVEHHDHTVVPATIAVSASCKAPAKPVTDADVFAEKPRTIEVGAKSAGAAAEPAHDAHADHYAGPPPEHTNMFFTIYFAMTGLHGIHVLVGVFVFIWLLIRAVKGHFTPEYFGPVDWAALYWHIVDLIWIFLFPLMYLIH